MSDLLDHCHAKGCEVEVGAGMLMCRDHWYQVPKPLRDEVNAAWQDRLRGVEGGRRRHMEAKVAAIAAVDE